MDPGPENERISVLDGTPGASRKTAFFKMVLETQEIHNRLERISRPTIAAIHGYCLGAGLELAACCDIRICSADAVFALPEATLAIITDVGTPAVPKIVGRGHAREMVPSHPTAGDESTASPVGNAHFCVPSGRMA